MGAIKPQPLAKRDLPLGSLDLEQPATCAIAGLVKHLFIRKLADEQILAQFSRWVLQLLLSVTVTV